MDFFITVNLFGYPMRQILSAINEQLTAKTSKLVNQNKWNQLGLPSGASSLLPE